MSLKKCYLYFLKISYLNTVQNLIYLLINLKKTLFHFAQYTLLICKYIKKMDTLIPSSGLQLFQFSLIKIYQINYYDQERLKGAKRGHLKNYFNFANCFLILDSLLQVARQLLGLFYEQYFCQCWVQFLAFFRFRITKDWFTPDQIILVLLLMLFLIVFLLQSRMIEILIYLLLLFAF